MFFSKHLRRANQIEFWLSQTWEHKQIRFSDHPGCSHLTNFVSPKYLIKPKKSQICSQYLLSIFTLSYNQKSWANTCMYDKQYNLHFFSIIMLYITVVLYICCCLLLYDTSNIGLNSFKIWCQLKSKTLHVWLVIKRKAKLKGYFWRQALLLQKVGWGFLINLN